MNEIDTFTTNPILVERGSKPGLPKRIEVWDLSDEKDEYGRPYAFSQDGSAAKAIGRETLSPEGQAELAEKLAQDRGLGHEALESTVVLAQEPEIISIPEVKSVNRYTPLEEESISSTFETSDNDPVLAQIFAPIIRPEDPVVDETKSGMIYDALISGTDEEVDAARKAFTDEDSLNEPIRKAQAEHDAFITDETRELASEQLARSMSADVELKDILKKYSISEASIDTVDALRTQKDLRYEVGVHLLQKLDRLISLHPDSFGDRFALNGSKKNDVHAMGVSKMTNRQYASTLALAMIDGSFNGDKQSDTSEYDANGKVIRGQHRDAARTLLRY